MLRFPMIHRLWFHSAIACLAAILVAHHARQTRAAIMLDGTIEEDGVESTDPPTGGGQLTILEGTLTIDDGSVLDSNRVEIGVDDLGRILVSGEDSALNVNGSIVASDGQLSILSIDDGATVTYTNIARIGFTGSSNLAITNGASLIGSGKLQLGDREDSTTTSLILSGSTVSTNGIDLGQRASSSGSTTISNAGTTVNSDSYFVVGDKGEGTLVLNLGAQLTNNIGVIGLESGSTGEATVSGSGTLWASTTRLEVGRNGIGELNLESGGRVESGDRLEINDQSTVTVRGLSTTLDVQDGPTISNGTIRVSENGTISTAGAILGRDVGSSALTTVSGTGSSLQSTTYLEVGFMGMATLNIEDGGRVESATAVLGRHAGTQGTINLDGSGSELEVSGTLRVGDAGNGTLNVAASATATINELFHIRDKGSVSLTDLGTSLTVNGNTINGGSFRVAEGAAATLNGGLSIRGVRGGGDVTLAGTIRPGTSIGAGTTDRMIHGGAISFAAGAILELELGGLDPGSSYDQLFMEEGSIALDGLLDISLIEGFMPTVGDQFTIVDNGSRATLNGTFIGALEGAVVATFDDIDLQISYIGGLGADVVLRAIVTGSAGDSNGAVPEPSAAALAGLIGGLILARRRRR